MGIEMPPNEKKMLLTNLLSKHFQKVIYSEQILSNANFTFSTNFFTSGL